MQTAKEVMTTPVITISASASVAEAMQVMAEKHLRGLMVEPSGAGDAYGIVTNADIVYKVAAYGKNPETMTVGEVMTKPCIEVDPDMIVQEVCQILAQNRLHRVPVVKDELLGVITVVDILRETMWWQG
ncbi:MAG TPA: CBS domain-containing protein [Rhodoplanes sp.]|nr:CBS domain-containing protein [Rhodoplanes sp.]